MTRACVLLLALAACDDEGGVRVDAAASDLAASVDLAVDDASFPGCSQLMQTARCSGADVVACEPYVPGCSPTFGAQPIAGKLCNVGGAATDSVVSGVFTDPSGHGCVATTTAALPPGTCETVTCQAAQLSYDTVISFAAIIGVDGGAPSCGPAGISNFFWNCTLP